MVVNVRGTSGSGKTTIVRGIMEKGAVTPLGGTLKKPDAYRLDISTGSSTPTGAIEHRKPIFIIGSYENVCGGCDAISSQDEICDRIRTYAPQGDVLVEGLLMSHLFSRYVMLDRELNDKGIHFVWGFLDTPLDVCIQRVEARREERRLAKKVVPEYKPLDVTNTTDKWNDMHRVYKKCTHPTLKDWKKVIGRKPEVLDARWIDHQNAVEQVYGWL